jgi:hypothetical protein
VYRGFRWGILRERDHTEDLGGQGKIILKWMSKKWVRAWIGLMPLMI